MSSDWPCIVLIRIYFMFEWRYLIWLEDEVNFICIFGNWINNTLITEFLFNKITFHWYIKIRHFRVKREVNTILKYLQILTILNIIRWILMHSWSAIFHTAIYKCYKRLTDFYQWIHPDFLVASCRSSKQTFNLLQSDYVMYRRSLDKKP